MLLKVKLSRLEIELGAHEFKYAVREYQIPANADGIRDQLDDICRDSDGRVSQGE